MKAERHCPFDVIVDRAGDADDLHTESFMDGPGPSETSVAAQYDQGGILQIRRKIPHRRLLHGFFLKVLKAAASDRAARMAAHSSGVVFIYGFDPIVRETEEAMPDKMDRQTMAVSRDPQLLQGGARPRKISARDQGHDPFDLSRLQGDAVFSDALDRDPALPCGPFTLRQSDGGRITGQSTMLIREQHHIVLTFFIVTEFCKRFVKRAGVQINHQRPQCRAVCVQTGHLAQVIFSQSVESIDHVDVQIEK